jgi:hypothetical protein
MRCLPSTAIVHITTTTTEAHNKTRPGGAAMPHASIQRAIRVGAEAESMATNLVRFCAVHTDNLE